MTTRVLYESANGESGVPMVEHKPNLSSGGRTSLTEMGQFLGAAGNGPEKQALLQLIGTLLDD